MIHDLGDKPTIRVTFRDEAGVVRDPTTVAFTMKRPVGADVVYDYGADAEVVRVSEGVYEVEWLLELEGEHFALFEGVGNVTASVETLLFVQTAHVARSLS